MNIPIYSAVTTQPSYQMLRLKQVVEYTGLSRSTIYDIMDTKSKRYDSTFPRSVKLTQARVAWVQSELNDWLESRIHKSREARGLSFAPTRFNDRATTTTQAYFLFLARPVAPSQKTLYRAVLSHKANLNTTPASNSQPRRPCE